jgi:glyoxylase-like metal-dependent hydrolase (beta-lactamase superfamily II)
MRSSFVLSIALLFVGAAAAAQQPARPSPIAPCTVSVTVPPPAPRSGSPGGAARPGRDGQPAGFAGPATEPPRLVKVTDDIYVVQNVHHTVADLGAFGGNATIYLTAAGVILVDSKSEREHDDLIAKIKTLTDKPIKYVVLTHNHGDHTGGAAKLQQEGATVIISADDRASLARAGQANIANVTYSGNGSLYLAGKEVQLTQYCGHTRGDTVAYFPAARVIAVGDLVAWPDTIPAIVNYGDGGNWTDALRALDTIAALDWTTLIPGHGPNMTKQDFAAYRMKFTAVVARTREMVKAGRSQQEISDALGKEFNWGAGPSAGNLPGLMIELK